MSEIIENKVAKSGLITLDLEDYFPKSTLLSIDLSDFLYEGLILKEKDFREKVQLYDWSIYTGQYVHIYCSADVLIPNWAYMIIATRLQGIAAMYVAGSKDTLVQYIFTQNLMAINKSDFEGQKVVVKGCGSGLVDSFAYTLVSSILSPVVQSLMYGEPCSTVPIFKKKS
jgi:hypothetical protein